tara:strand:+ start:397 stop:759 length:363 start_codon:yes stop_codon:yes gene_type:complete
MYYGRMGNKVPFLNPSVTLGHKSDKIPNDDKVFYFYPCIKVHQALTSKRWTATFVNYGADNIVSKKKNDESLSDFENAKLVCYQLMARQTKHKNKRGLIIGAGYDYDYWYFLVETIAEES